MRNNRFLYEDIKSFSRQIFSKYEQHKTRKYIMTGYAGENVEWQYHIYIIIILDVD